VSPESDQHVNIKDIVEKKLREWYGASINEYYDSGHELDVYAVTPSGLSIYTEVVWHPSLSHLKHDLLILERSDADVKLIIANPEIIKNDKLIKEYNKTVISQRKKGVVIFGTMINGDRILKDNEYTNFELKGIFDSLILEKESLTDDEKSDYYFLERLDELMEEDIEKTFYYGKENNPRIKLLIGPTNDLGEIFEPNQAYAWLMSTFPDISHKGVTFRRNWFDCDTYNDIYLKVYMDGFLYYITPLLLDEDRNLFYIDTTINQIIFQLIHYIRILKVLNIDTEFSFKIIFKNVSSLIFGYDRRRISRQYHLSDDSGEIIFDYDFNPIQNWSEIKELFFKIYRSLCVELGSSIEDIWLKRRVYRMIRNNKYINTTFNNHKYQELMILNININEFHFSEDEMNIR